MSEPDLKNNTYHRYHIETRPAPDIISWPNRFQVKVSKIGLAKLLISEIFAQKGDMKAVTGRPCMYGTFSGPIGGFAPRPQHCVGCLRCTVQHPDMVQIVPNPARQELGDSYFQFQQINAVVYEAETGNIPVKGAGYRGKFGGEGWDGMWTDMSEIVRPTRDGIHGREFISTTVDLGEKPGYLSFSQDGLPRGGQPKLISLPIPFLFDTPPDSVAGPLLYQILSEAAAGIDTLAVLPFSYILQEGLTSPNVIPLIGPTELAQVSNRSFAPLMIEIDAGRDLTTLSDRLYAETQRLFSDAVLVLRIPYLDDQTLLSAYRQGWRVFHLVADLHGRSQDGRFAIDAIRQAHTAFVREGLRDEVTLIGSGGIVAAEHVPKAIICGLDAVALDTPLLAALQAQFNGDCADRAGSSFSLPTDLNLEWGVQRLKNLAAAWHGQLLEILGAMGLREVRRMRGEIGRAMFQIELEREAFAEIEGYEC